VKIRDVSFCTLSFALVSQNKMGKKSKTLEATFGSIIWHGKMHHGWNIGTLS
jgi:hypothetical protein